MYDRPRHISKETLLMGRRRRWRYEVWKEEKGTDKFHLIFEGKIREMPRLMSVLTMP